MAFLAKTQPLIERGEIKVWSSGSKSALPNNEGFFFFWSLEPVEESVLRSVHFNLKFQEDSMATVI